jgi:predicted DNA-binding transcriptional regulator AlpA
MPVSSKGKSPPLDSAPPAPASEVPQRHHLDRRAEPLIAAGAGADDDLLSTRELATWLGVSEQWCEIARHRGYGPRYVRIGPRRIRYRRADVIIFLQERRHSATSEYRDAS